MKSVLAALVLCSSFAAFANEGAPAATKKLSKKEARALCKKEGKKKHDLESCVKEKMM